MLGAEYLLVMLGVVFVGVLAIEVAYWAGYHAGKGSK